MIKNIRKQILLSCLLTAAVTVSRAQEGSFGIISYKIPGGYETVKKDDVLTYYKQDKSTGAFCMFFIYDLVNGKENTKNDFDFAWTNIVKKNLSATAEPVMQPETELKGWKFLTGKVNVTLKGIANLAILFTFSGENKTQSVYILSNNDNYKNDIEDFIASADVVREIKTTTKPAAPNVTGSSKNLAYEVWECNCPNLATGTQVTTKLNTVVISPEGKYLTYMPEKGLNGVTPENSNETGSWGTVTDRGNMLSLVNDRYGKMELYKLDAKTRSRYPNLKSSLYKKVQPVNGLQFEGAYSPELSYYNGKPDIISKQIDPGKRPIIFFKKDGTYINEGIEFSNLTYGDSYAIGKGTYEIVNYSLVLTTQSGRKLQVAFTPVLDANPAAADNPGFIINNNLFYRLNKTFVPQ
ncbi:MAG: hypothetical protein U0V75_12550 [Ferruginibacter sp.]